VLPNASFFQSLYLMMICIFCGIEGVDFVAFVLICCVGCKLLFCLDLCLFVLFAMKMEGVSNEAVFCAMPS